MNISPEQTISINGSHDCSCTFIDNKNKLRIYEYERYVNQRYAMFSKKLENHISQGIHIGTNDSQRESFLLHLKKNLLTQDIRLILHHDMFSENDFKLLKKHFPHAEFKYCNHHESHAYGAFHLSKFKDCIIFSIDGGGRDNGVVSTTNVYLYKNSKLQHIDRPNLDVGNPYNNTALGLKDIKGLGPAGKLMGLTAYGKIKTEWISSMKSFYSHNNISRLMKEINFLEYPATGQLAWDLARTSQYVFEELLFDVVKKYVNKYNLNVILTGGCALNVLFNQRVYQYLQEKNLSLYIPPNPNDCGLSYGMFVNYHKELNKDEICFNGFEILDADDINLYTNPYEILNLTTLAQYICDGKIVAILDGNSEVGPRALGNRSIICYPGFADMKDTLNSKVKFREWFRPFAPVCKNEQKDLFFEHAPDCKYMSFAPIVKQEWRDKLPSITHIDNTSRLQTVNKGTLFYDLLTEMESIGMIPMIINTSFNIKGRPILTRLSDAFHVLNTTELDLLVYDNKIYRKN